MIPLSELDSIEFSILGSLENEIKSFVEVKTSETFKQGKAVENGVYDPSMGTFNFDIRCKVCKKTNTTCQGHMGHINLKYPSKNSLFISEISLWLKSVCFTCSKLLTTIDKLNKIQQSNIPKSKILNEYAGKIFSGTNKIVFCPHCGNESPNITKNKGEALIIYAEYYDMKMVNGKKTFHVRKKEEIPNTKIKNILDKISDETVLMLGKSLICHPKKLIIDTLGVSPNVIRPDKKKTSTNNAFNSDITTLLQGVVDINNKAPKTPNSPIMSEIGKSIELHIYDMIKGSGGNKTNITNHSKQQLVSLADRQSGKKGRVRKNMMGKRVKNAARSTITCGPHLELDEIGMPIEICRDILFPVIVQEYNYEECNFYFKNGSDIYPGCKSIKKIKTGTTYGTTASNVKKYKLEIGDIIYRDLVDGDYFNFTRAPSLEPSSMTSMRIKVIESGLTMQLNVISCSLFNADFDGDAMTANFSPSLSTATEIEMLSSVNERMLPYKKSSSMIGEAQDSLIGTAYLTNNKIKMDRYHANKMFNIINIYHDFSKYAPDHLFTGRDIISILFSEMNINLNYKTKATYYSPAKEMFRSYDPDNVNVEFKDGKLISGILDKKSIGEKSANTIFHIVAKSYGTNKALDLCYKIQQIALEFLNHYSVSVSIRDVIVKDEFLEEIYKIETSLIADSMEITQRLNDKKIIAPIEKSLKQYYEEMQINALSIGDKYFEPYVKNLDWNNNSMNSLVAHGSKGKMNNLKNYCVQIGQIYLDGERIPETFGKRTCCYFPNYDSDPKARGYVANSYMSGMDPAEFYFHCIDDRNGLIAIALSTSVSGTAGRALIKNLEPNIVNNKRFVQNNDKITQILYGGDGLDPRYLEKVYILTCQTGISDSDFTKQYKINDNEFKILWDDRKWFIDYKLKNERKYNEIYENSMMCTFNIKRIIENIHFDVGGSDKLIEESAFNEVIGLCKSIEYSYFNEMFEKQGRKIPYHIKTACKMILIYIRSWLNIYNLQKMNISNNKLIIICNTILLKFSNSFIDYGTCVGDIASVSYAEPITQAVIDSKHRSGLGEQTTGIARINELLGNALTQKMKNPFIKIELKDKYLYKKGSDEINEVKIQKIINKIKEFKVSVFVKKYQIFVEKYGNPIHSDYKSESELIKNFEKYNKKPENSLVHFCLRIEFIKMTMIEKKITVSDIAAKLSQIFNFIYIVYTPDNVENIVMRIYFQKVDDNGNDIDKDYILNFTKNLPDITIRGISGIKNARKENKIIHIQQKDGTLKQKKIIILYINGINITGILSTKYFKNHTFMTNAVEDIEKRFGILSARMSLAKQLHGQVSNGISYRHVTLFADEMTSTGTVTSLNRFGSRYRNSSVLLRISDSDPIRVMTRAAINNIKDSLSGVSPSLMVGKYPNIGTTFNNISLDEEFIINEIENKTKILNEL